MALNPAITTTPNTRLRILISGAGIAGGALAFWLARANVADITVVERDPEMRTTGQSIDIRGEAVNIVKAMGLIDEVKAHTTAEAGVQHVDSKGKVHGKFDAAPPGSDKQSFTSEFEIFRGELAEIFYQASKDDAEYIFGDQITSIAQSDHHVTVSFAKGEQRDFDLVVGADGIGSKLRAMTFHVSRRQYLHPLGGWNCFFTIKNDLLNGSKYASWYNAPGSRMMLLRPDPNNYTRASMGQIFNSKTESIDQFRRAQEEGPEALKKFVRGVYMGAGWLTPEILDGMNIAEDFYVQEMAQIKMPALHKGRVTFVGDAGSCPSPLSGMGTSLAIIQAYLLAGEVMKRATNIPKALESYNDICQPIVKEVQNIPSGLMKLMSPQSKIAILLMRSLFSFVSHTHLDRAMFTFMAGFGSKKEKAIVPQYEWPERQGAKKIDVA